MRNPSAPLIGAFVVGAFLLVIAGIIILGAGRFITRHPTYVMYFDGSVKGLSNGAPVMFKGVKVGKIESIGLQYDPDTRKVLIVVISAINLKSITRPDGKEVTEAFFRKLISQGLKAQLQFQNYVTGQLLVDLDFYPGRPARFVSPHLAHPEIPTTPSSLELLSKGVENVPLDQVVARLARAVDSLSSLASSPELKQTITSMSLAVKDLRAISRTVNENLGPLMTDTRRMVRHLDGQSLELQARADETLEAARSALEETEKVLSSLDRAGAGGQNIVAQLSESLEKASDAADSFKTLADYLNRHPEALIRGKRSGD
jgi:paraquat-inducible protein B